MNAYLEGTPRQFSKVRITNSTVKMYGQEFSFPSYESIDWDGQTYSSNKLKRSKSISFNANGQTPELSPHYYDHTPYIFKAPPIHHSNLRNKGKQLFNTSLDSDGFTEGSSSSYETINVSNNYSLPEINVFKDTPKLKPTISFKNKVKVLPSADDVAKKEVPATSSTNNYFEQKEELLVKFKDECPSPTVSNKEDFLLTELKLKKNEVCTIMQQISSLLKLMKTTKTKKTNLSIELLAERLLLESYVKCSLLENQISNFEDIPKKQPHKGSLSISNFNFPLKSNGKKSKGTEFYVLLVNDGATLHLSKTVQPFEDGLDFGETFIFPDENSDFIISIRVYRIQFKKSKKGFKLLFKKQSKPKLNETTIQYMNLLTNTIQESKILTTSFELVGEIFLTKNHIGNKSPWSLDWVSDNSRLQNKAFFSFSLDRLTIDSKLTGFMNMGQEIGDRVFWEKKWCVLRETQLKIFNYPSFEDIVDPVQCLNLIYSVGPSTVTTNGAKKSFLLKIARPSTCEDVDRPSLRSKPNFVLDKYFFSSDAYKDFQKWNGEVKTIIDTLNDWKKVIFVEEDCE